MTKETIEELRKIKEVMIGYDDFTQDDLFAIDKAIIACEQLRRYKKKAKRWKRKYLKYAKQEPCDNHEEKPHSLLDAYFQMKAEQEPNEDKMYFEYMRGYDKGRESVKPCEDAVSRGVFEQVKWERDIAIEQLNELGYELGQKIEPSDDVVSRQAVEDKLLKLCNELEGIFSNIRMQNQDESVCGLCEYDCPAPYECPGFDIEDCFKLADEIRHKWQSTKELPSVRPQEQTGQWIKVTNGRGGHECDVCHDYAPSYQNGDEYLTKFCPNCGARMESEQNE